MPPDGCADYDVWHYGLRDRNSYAERLPADSIRARLARHDVRILPGAADTATASLDASRGADPREPRRHHRDRAPVRFRGRNVRRARPPRDDRGGRGALQPIRCGRRGGDGGALRRPSAARGPAGGRFRRPAGGFGADSGRGARDQFATRVHFRRDFANFLS